MLRQKAVARVTGADHCFRVVLLEMRGLGGLMTNENRLVAWRPKQYLFNVLISQDTLFLMWLSGWTSLRGWLGSEGGRTSRFTCPPCSPHAAYQQTKACTGALNTRGLASMAELRTQLGFRGREVSVRMSLSCAHSPAPSEFRWPSPISDTDSFPGALSAMDLRVYVYACACT